MGWLEPDDCAEATDDVEVVVAVAVGGGPAKTKIPNVVKLLFSLDSSTMLPPSTFNSIKLYPSEAQYKPLQEEV